jgi:hypothetical protein
MKENRRKTTNREEKHTIMPAKGGGIGKDTDFDRNQKPLRF